MPQISPFELEMQRQSFVMKMGETLQLDDDDKLALMDVPAETFMYWGVTVFAPEENEVRVPECSAEAVFGSKDNNELFGGKVIKDNAPMWDLRKGELARRVGQLYGSVHESDQQRFTTVSKATAKMVFSAVAGIGLESHTVQSLIAANPDIVLHLSDAAGPELCVQGAAPYTLQQSSEQVALLNPGMAGGKFAYHALGAMREVHFVTEGMGGQFVNNWNDLQMLAQENGRRQVRDSIPDTVFSGVDIMRVEAPEPRFHHEGVAKAAEQFGPDSLDMVILRAGHATSEETCLKGIEMAARSLRQDGLFVVKAPDIAAPGQAGLDKIALPAQEEFGSPVSAGNAAPIVQFADPTLPSQRSASYLLYQR